MFEACVRRVHVRVREFVFVFLYGGFGKKLELRANPTSCLIKRARLASNGRIYSMFCLLRGRGLARFMINDVDGSKCAC